MGYEILFSKYFYTYTPPRKLEEINNELEKLEKEVQDLLKRLCNENFKESGIEWLGEIRSIGKW